LQQAGALTIGPQNNAVLLRFEALPGIGFISAATISAIQAKDNPFQRKYLDMTLLHGIAPHRAKLTIARDMLATMWAMWRKGEKYNPEIREKAAYKQG